MNLWSEYRSSHPDFPLWLAESLEETIRYSKFVSWPSLPGKEWIQQCQFSSSLWRLPMLVHLFLWCLLFLIMLPSPMVFWCRLQPAPKEDCSLERIWFIPSNPCLSKCKGRWSVNTYTQDLVYCWLHFHRERGGTWTLKDRSLLQAAALGLWPVRWLREPSFAGSEPGCWV